MQVYVAAAGEELESRFQAICEVARDLGHEVTTRETPRATPPEEGLKAVSICRRRAALADLVIAMIGRRRGAAPDVEEGGDDSTPWVGWELRSAFEHDVSAAVLLADSTFPDSADDSEGRTVMQELRAESARIGVGFSAEDEDLREFRDLVRRQLDLYSAHAGSGDFDRRQAALGEELLRPRRVPLPPLPDRPYPLLLSITHPDLLAGREHELTEVLRDLKRPIPITGIYATSGTGKSSFLRAALISALRVEGRPAALDRRPCEPGLAQRLLQAAATGPEAKLDVGDEEPHAFADRLADLHRSAQAPPVLVLDQFEDVFRRPDAARARSVVGALLAASVQRLPGLDGPPCRWILAYRQEFHGDVLLWLSDVLRDVRRTDLALHEDLPRDLSGPERFQCRPLPPLGTPPSGTRDVVGAASRIFQEAIEKPLAAGPYPWFFATDDARRLAHAFGEARAHRPEAPLAPELQVVLAHLMESCDDPGDLAQIGTAPRIRIPVPQQPQELIDEALEDHLRRALDIAFPAAGRSAKVRRSRALLLLRELADGVSSREFADEDVAVLERLATPRTRLTTVQRRGGRLVYRLAHDRLAELLVRLTDQGRYAALGVDRELLELRRFVEIQSELFAAGEPTAVKLAHDRFGLIQNHRDVLLWTENHRTWWATCEAARQARRRKFRLRSAAAALLLTTATLFAWLRADDRAQQAALLEEIAAGDPEQAFAAVDRLLANQAAETDEILNALRRRASPLDVLERGIGGVAEDERPAAVLRAARLVLPLITQDADDDPTRIAAMVWALDFFAPEEAPEGESARRVRDQALQTLREKRPPPPEPQPNDPRWIAVPAGAFSAAQRAQATEHAPATFRTAAFRLGAYEVTNQEFLRLFPNHAPDRDPDLPAVGMSWHQAYVYAAWLGGRLPTAAEAEYVRRGGCEFALCRRDGREATLDEVAWWSGNSTDPRTGEPSPRPVGLLEPDPWGFFDLYGNVWEFSADWQNDSADDSRPDDPAPESIVTDSPVFQKRLAHGGSAQSSAREISPDTSAAITARRGSQNYGLRVLLPAAESSASGRTTRKP